LSKATAEEKKKERGLFRRKNSPYWWIRYTDENGKIVRTSTEQNSKTTAINILTDGTTKTVRTGMIEIWKKGFGNVSVKEIDQRSVVRFLNEHMQPKKNDNQADGIKRNGGAKRAASASTRNRHLGMLRALFNKGIEWGLVGGPNPCDGISKLREAPARDRFLTPEEVENLLANAPATLKPILIDTAKSSTSSGLTLISSTDW